MKTIVPGHMYELANKLDGTQVLQFFKDLPELESTVDGVLCQEVIRAILDRLHELFTQQPCYETLAIIKHLRKCLILFEKRAFGNTLEKSYRKSGLHVEQLPVKSNGHIYKLG